MAIQWIVSRSWSSAEYEQMRDERSEHVKKANGKAQSPTLDAYETRGRTYRASATGDDAVEGQGFRYTRAHAARAGRLDGLIDGPLLLFAIERSGRSANERRTGVIESVDHG